MVLILGDGARVVTQKRTENPQAMSPRQVLRSKVKGINSSYNMWPRYLESSIVLTGQDGLARATFAVLAVRGMCWDPRRC